MVECVISDMSLDGVICRHAALLEDIDRRLKIRYDRDQTGWRHPSPSQEGSGSAELSMESQKGTYALILKASVHSSVQVGRLGTLFIRPGTYIYVGSALGPGGVAARVRRHFRRSGVQHWHIDYLLPIMQIDAVWYVHGSVSREHVWAELFLHWSDSEVQLPGFGASDCRCKSHLFFFETPPTLHAFGEMASCKILVFVPEGAGQQPSASGNLSD